MARQSLTRLLISSVLGLLVGCSQGKSAADAFVRDLGAAYQGLKGNQELRVSDVNKGDWNLLYIFAPYTPLSEMASALKVKVPPAIADSGISERDDINLLVFLNGQEVRMVAAVPRAIVDVSVSQGVQPLNQQTAVFRKGDPGRSLVWVGK